MTATPNVIPERATDAQAAAADASQAASCLSLSQDDDCQCAPSDMAAWTKRALANHAALRASSVFAGHLRRHVRVACVGTLCDSDVLKALDADTAQHGSQREGLAYNLNPLRQRPLLLLSPTIAEDCVLHFCTSGRGCIEAPLKAGTRTPKALLGALARLGKGAHPYSPGEYPSLSSDPQWPAILATWTRALARMGEVWATANDPKRYIVTLSIAPSTFLRLGTYAPDKNAGSCYKPGGEWERSKWILAQHASTYVALVYNDVEPDVALPSDGSALKARCIARLWGRMAASAPAYLATNAYGMERPASVHSVVKAAFSSVYGVDAAAWTSADVDATYHDSDNVYVNGDTKALEAAPNAASAIDALERGIHVDSLDGSKVCSECAGRLRHDHYSCYDCGATLCAGCGTTHNNELRCSECTPCCERCNERLCDDEVEAQDTGDALCQSCAIQCSDCGEWYSRRYAMDAEGRCQDCHDEAERAEAEAAQPTLELEDAR